MISIMGEKNKFWRTVAYLVLLKIKTALKILFCKTYFEGRNRVGQADNY
jgi:hypothetical protein